MTYDDTMQRIREYLDANVTTRCIPTPEEIAPEDPSFGYEPETIAAINNAVNNADGCWGWCSIEVKCSLTNIITSDSEYLGAGSYLSRSDFVLNSVYYDDMRKECIEDLANKLFRIHHLIDHLIEKETK